MSFRNKLVLLYLLLFGLLLMVTIFGSYLQSAAIMREQTETYVSEILGQSQMNIEYRIREMEGISNLVFSNTVLQDVIRRSESADSNYIEQYDDFISLQSYISTLTSNYGTYRFSFFISGTILYSSEYVNFFKISDIEKRPWFKLAENKNGGIIWVSLSSADNPADGDSISAVRTLKDLTMDYGRRLGILKIDMVESDIAKILDNVNLSTLSGVYLIDENGNVISSKNRDARGMKLDDGILTSIHGKGENGAIMIDSDGARQFVVYRDVGAAGWKLVASIPYSELIKDIVKVRNANMAFLVLLFLLSLAIVLIFSDRFTKRIRIISNKMSRIEQQHFSESIPVKYNDELSIIENKFNDMTTEIKNLLKDIYISETKKREAELNALQAQINPHFLYNTLDTINWMAQDCGAVDISTTVSALGRFFRLSLHGGKTIVSIREEVEQAKSYMMIQQMRFKGLLEVGYHIDDEVLSYSTIKLVLQPILENAIKHGIQPKREENGRIDIYGEKVGTSIRFQIVDNGVGFDEGKPDSERSNGNGERIAGLSGYGLKNVRERLELAYANAFQLEIVSAPAQGTSVMLQWPAEPYEQPDTEHMHG